LIRSLFLPDTQPQPSSSVRMDSAPSSSSSSASSSAAVPGGSVGGVHASSQQPPAVKVENGGTTELSSHNCAGCQCRIADRYMLEALGKFWHEDCLKVRLFAHAINNRAITLFSLFSVPAATTAWASLDQSCITRKT